jgi:putative endonuclease
VDTSLKEFGAGGEEAAKDYLQGKGYRWRESNFRTRGGEIDLVMEDGAILVFVEVKRRRSDEYGLPEEAITPGKMRHMIKTALFYIKIKNLRDRMVRFDVITIDRDGLRHYADAFQADGSYYY